MYGSELQIRVVLLTLYQLPSFVRLFSVDVGSSASTRSLSNSVLNLELHFFFADLSNVSFALRFGFDNDIVNGYKCLNTEKDSS
mgnify:CR=1 FL=1